MSRKNVEVKFETDTQHVVFYTMIHDIAERDRGVSDTLHTKESTYYFPQLLEIFDEYLWEILAKENDETVEQVGQLFHKLEEQILHARAAFRK